MTFVLLNPSEQFSDSLWSIFCTDAEMAAITSAAQLRTLVSNKLTRTVKRNGFAARLDPFIGAEVTI